MKIKKNKLKNHDQQATFQLKGFGRFGGYFVLIFFVCLILGPLFIVLNVSFKSMEEYLNNGVYSIAENFFNISNYIEAFETGGFLQAFANTGILLVTCVPISILMGTMVAYILDRFTFKFKKAIFTAFVVPTFIPMMTVSIATFTIIRMLGLYNSIFAGILIYIGSDIVQIYIFLQFMKQIPIAVDESAMIDGASKFRIFYSIILPQLRPAIATAAILKILAIYNDFFTPYLYMPDSELKTVATALNSFSGDKMANWPLMSAAIIFVAIPTIVIYILLQKHIIGGVTDGAVK